MPRGHRIVARAVVALLDGSAWSRLKGQSGWPEAVAREDAAADGDETDTDPWKVRSQSV
jgi:hypothetical protein